MKERKVVIQEKRNKPNQEEEEAVAARKQIWKANYFTHFSPLALFSLEPLLFVVREKASRAGDGDTKPAQWLWPLWVRMIPWLKEPSVKWWTDRRLMELSLLSSFAGSCQVARLSVGLDRGCPTGPSHPANPANPGMGFSISILGQVGYQGQTYILKSYTKVEFSSYKYSSFNPS